MLQKDKAETILTEIKQKIHSGNADSIAFSSQTILWMAESLVAAIAEVEKIRRAQEAAVKAITAEKDQAVAEMKKLKEDYFKLTQNFRKAETSGIAMESKDKLLKKWRGEPK